MKITSQVPANILRVILVTHRKITCLTISCLSFYLKRFKPLRPSHLADDKYFFESQDIFVDGEFSHFYPAWQKWPAVTPCPVVDIGPPTWVEEQRVLRAFWRVQLVHDMRSLRDIADWDFMNLDGMSVVGLYDVPTQDLEGQCYIEPTIFQQDGLLEHELIWAAVEYMEEERQAIETRTFLETKRDWQVPTPQVARESDILDDDTSDTYTLFCRMSRSWTQHPTGGQCSLSQHVSFTPFRRLGFAIWGSERMSKYGFLLVETRYVLLGGVFLNQKI